MNKREIKNRFFTELEKGLPVISEIPLPSVEIDSNRKRKAVLITALAIAVPALVSGVTAALISTASESKKTLSVVPEKSGMPESPEAADWETRIEIEEGPSKSPIAKVTFGNHGLFPRWLSDWNKDSPLRRFNGEQPTRLKLLRYVFYYISPFETEAKITTVYENVSNFYDHVCSETFSIYSSFSVEDKLNMDDFPKGLEGKEFYLSLQYAVWLEAADGEPLDYDVEWPGDVGGPSPYIRSSRNAWVSYLVLENGVKFYKEENYGSQPNRIRNNGGYRHCNYAFRKKLF